MGNKGGGGGGSQVITPGRPNIPNEDVLQPGARSRFLSQYPYMSSPYRTIDFGHMYSAPQMQLPTFTQGGFQQPYGLNYPTYDPYAQYGMGQQMGAMPTQSPMGQWGQQPMMGGGGGGQMPPGGGQMGGLKPMLMGMLQPQGQPQVPPGMGFQESPGQAQTGGGDITTAVEAKPGKKAT